MGNATKFNGIGVSGQGSDDRVFLSDREDTGLAALEGLSLKELAVIAVREIGEARQLQAEAVGFSRRSTVTLYRAGRVLLCARKKLKGKGKRTWTKWQKSNGIPVTSAWQAIRLYEEAESEEAVAGLTRSQALQKYGITRPKKDRTKPTPEVVGEATGGAAHPEVSTPDLRVVGQRNDEVAGESPAQGGGAADRGGAGAPRGSEHAPRDRDSRPHRQAAGDPGAGHPRRNPG